MRISDFLNSESVKPEGQDVSPEVGEPGSFVEQEGGEEPTPQEQQKYEQLVMAGIKVLTEATDQILQMLQAGADNPPQALSDTTWTIMSALDEKSGGKIEEGILFAAGAEVMQNVGEFANESGIFEVNQKTLDDAWLIIMKRIEAEYGINWQEEMGGQDMQQEPVPGQPDAQWQRGRDGL